MKRLFTALMLVLTLSLTAQQSSGFGNDYIFASDNFIEIDKQYHFVGGFVFGGVGYLLGLDLYDGDRNKAVWTAVAVGTGANLMKEVTDIGKTGFNAEDLAFGMLGSVVSAWVTDKLFYPVYENRKQEALAEIKEAERQRLASLTDEQRLLESISN